MKYFRVWDLISEIPNPRQVGEWGGAVDDSAFNSVIAAGLPFLSATFASKSHLRSCNFLGSTKLNKIITFILELRVLIDLRFLATSNPAALTPILLSPAPHHKPSTQLVGLAFVPITPRAPTPSYHKQPSSDTLLKPKRIHLLNISPPPCC